MKSSSGRKGSFLRLIIGIAIVAICFAVLFPIFARPSVRPNRDGERRGYVLVVNAEALVEKDDLEEAKKLYRRFLISPPSSAVRDVSPRTTQAVASERQSETAKRNYERYLVESKGRLRRDDPLIVARYADLCLETGDRVGEKWAYNTILERQGGTTFWFSLWGDSFPTGSSMALLRGRVETIVGKWISDRAKGETDYLAAIEHFDSALRSNPSDPVTFYVKGLVLEQMKSDIEASKLYYTAQRQQNVSANLKKLLQERLKSIASRHPGETTDEQRIPRIAGQTEKSVRSR